MTNPRRLDRLSEIAGDFDAMLCDAWGVIHDGVTLFNGVTEALTRFRRERGPVIILTNAPRPSSIIPAQLDRIGLPREAYDAVVTSGDATRAGIAAHLPAKAFKLGPAKDDALYDGMDIEFRPIEEAGFIICTGMTDDQRDKPEDYVDLLKSAAARRLPMICANPDIVVRWGGRIIYCAGALAELYQRLGGDVMYGGKPHPPIYEIAMAAIDSAAGKPIPRKRVLAVGDGVNTDIAGANAQGIPALFIAGAGGIHDDDADADGIARALDRAGVHARFTSAGLLW